MPTIGQRMESGRAARTGRDTPFGDLLRQLRSAAGFSQEALAERAGLSRNGISDLERGARLIPRLETVRLLADALDLTFGDRAALLAAARPALLGHRPSGSAPAFPIAFPSPLTRLIGRDAELAGLRARLEDEDENVRLLTLTGPGGVGKTRLAIAVALASRDAFGDGVAFVPLAAVGEPALVLPAIARALDIRDTVGRSLAEALVSTLHDRHLLLVLDNFEHVLTAATELATLLEACPRVTALVTSRAPLHLRGEQRLVTPPLTLPAPTDDSALDALADYAAIALFVERARSVQHTFTLDAGNAEAVVAICRHLDGLPLAIELAAAWTHLLPPPDLLRRLEHRLPLLRGGAEDQPLRLQTMRNAIAWSYDLLPAEEARLFRRLAVFVGGFTIESAERAWAAAAGPCGPAPDAASALDLLVELIDKSLIQPIQVEGSEPRFAMLETVREFAHERLTVSGEEAALEVAHAAYVVDVAERLEPDMLGPNERQSHARVDAELGNVRAALNWALEHDVETVLRIGAALWVYWAWRQLAEGRRWLAAALAGQDSGSDLLRARALTTYGALAALEGDSVTAVEATRAAVILAHAAGNPSAEAMARWIAATGYFYTGDVAPAAAELDEALALFTQATTTTTRAFGAYARANRAITVLVDGDVTTALAVFEEALAEARAAKSDGITILILSDLAGWLIDLGETSRARGMLHEALALGAAYRGRWLLGPALIGLTLIEALMGERERAARQLGAWEAVEIQSGVAALPFYQHRLAQATALITATLDEHAFALAKAAGRADPGAVIAEALASLNAAPPAAISDPGDLLAIATGALTLLAVGVQVASLARSLFIP